MVKNVVGVSPVFGCPPEETAMADIVPCYGAAEEDVGKGGRISLMIIYVSRIRKYRYQS